MHVTSLANPFPVARYRLHSIVERTLDMPDFAGSTLRGAFGHALKRSVCVTGQHDCKSCPLYRSCAYPAIFETPPPDNARRTYSQIPNPYVVEPPLNGAQRLHKGEPLLFDLVLIGPALAQLPLILLAWQRALDRDIGKLHGAARLARVCDEDGASVLEPECGSLGDHAQTQQLPPAPPTLDEVNLSFHTPLNLRRDGKDLDERTITARDLLMALVRRTSDLALMQLDVSLDLDYAGLNHAASQVRAQADLKWQGWTRYSNRQRRSMRIGGLVGHWRLRGALEPFWPFLYLGQWLHVGKKCTFGLGQYTLQGGHDDKPA